MIEWIGGLIHEGKWCQQFKSTKRTWEKLYINIVWILICSHVRWVSQMSQTDPRSRTRTRTWPLRLGFWPWHTQSMNREVGCVKAYSGFSKKHCASVHYRLDKTSERPAAFMLLSFCHVLRRQQWELASTVTTPFVYWSVGGQWS